MNISDFFADDYMQARERFLAACPTGAELLAWENPRKEPGGGALVTDVAWIGPRDAERVLVAVSGTHGVEGFFGSGCQVGWLREERWRDMPVDTAVMLIHAINPYGFAWVRRVNEDNMDINRNFVDFAHLPENPAYDEVADILIPETWTPESVAAMEAAIADFVARRGEKAFRAAVVGGQHSHSDGLFYGGTAPCWSNRTVGEICHRFLAVARHVAVLDFHTGLGPHAHAELICRHQPGSEALVRARRWYGADVTSPQSGESDSPPIEGNLRMAFVDLLPGAQVTSIAVEMGTRPSDQVLRAVIADNWLHLRGDLDSATGREIKREIRDAFFPDTEDWKARAYGRTMEIMALAFTGLALS